jgi:hypothetical protein
MQRYNTSSLQKLLHKKVCITTISNSTFKGLLSQLSPEGKYLIIQVEGSKITGKNSLSNNYYTKEIRIFLKDIYDISESTLMIRCPNCEKASDSIKCYRMVSVIFIFIGAQIRGKNEIGCPSCIRQKIKDFMLINLLTANIAWPLAIFPVGVFYWAISYRSGHSSIVLKSIE